MRTIRYLIQKEFIQVFRNKTILPFIFVMPVIQLVIMVNAATLEMKKIDMVVVDSDLSTTSRQLVSKFEGSPFFKMHGATTSIKEAESALKANAAEIVLCIPSGFERKLVRDTKSDLQVIINAIDGTAAGLINAYTLGIISDYNQHVNIKWMGIDKSQFQMPITVKRRFWYNPTLEYHIYMLPGILVILVTIIGMFLSAFNIVREKEMGTIEQINVTPIKKHQFIIGKLFPFLVIALFEFSLGLLLGVLFFHQPVEGKLIVLYTSTFLFLLVCLGLGLYFSTISNTQQQVMFTLYFFLLIFILMSGIFTPTESMPKWAQIVNYLNPFSYFMKTIRMILLKGSGFSDVSASLIGLGVYAVIANAMAIWRYRKTV